MILSDIRTITLHTTVKVVYSNQRETEMLQIQGKRAPS